MQRRVPEALRGRVMALWSVALLGSRPFAALVDGSVADLFGITTALLLAGAVPLLAAVGLTRMADDEPARALSFRRSLEALPEPCTEVRHM